MHPSEQDQMNMFRHGITSFAYIPLSTASPEAHKKLVDSVTAYIDEQKIKGELPAGLLDQYEIQLRHLKDDTIPDMEFLGFPGWITHQCEVEFCS